VTAWRAACLQLTVPFGRAALLSSPDAPKMAQFMASRFRKLNSFAAQRTLLGFAVSAPIYNDPTCNDPIRNKLTGDPRRTHD
jgi:hypothetical protein